ncbi:MAG: hypothetical protein Q8S22_05385 [Eubacteriales bacterium]|nr:hypothetical protein [Eubacteriales bacterium]
MKTGIAVCFPGTGFTCKEALFERLASDLSARGYDVVRLDFSHIPFREIESLEEAVAVAQRAVKRQLSGVSFADYDDVVFLSKSLGTILAPRAEQEYGIRPRHLFLTPLNKTLSLVHPDSRVIAMVLGTQDRFLSGRALTSFCEPRGINCCLIEGVNHSLKDDMDAARTAQIIDQIAMLCN